MKDKTTFNFSRNIFYNISGPVLPVISAALTIPILINRIGTDRFGLLTIAWMVVGYFNLFDLGLGRALTKLTSERLGSRRDHEVPALLAAGLSLMFVLGITGSVIVGLLSTEITRLLHTPNEYAGETRSAFILLAISIPAVILATGLRGILEAYQRFDITNAIRTPLGLWTFIGPLCALPFTSRLDWIVLFLVIGRITSTLFFLYYTKKQIKSPLFYFPRNKTLYIELLSFGGWMTVSNVISPLMVYMDRFFIGAILGTSIVAFYTTPYEVVFKLNIISEGLLGVLFPMMARSISAHQSFSSSMLTTGTKLIAACLFPPVLIITLFSQNFLTIWLGGDFPKHSTLVMQLLAIGLLVNGFAKVPFNLLQAHGRADVTAKLHLLELPIYIVTLVLFTRRWGIEGAAACWALRIFLDTTLLYVMTSCATQVARTAIRKSSCLAGFSAFIVFPSLFIIQNNIRFTYLTLTTAIYGLLFFKIITNKKNTNIFKSIFKSRNAQ